MVKGKRIRNKGKIKFSEYFKKISDGERVAVVKEPSIASVFPERILGRTGVVEGSRGVYKVVKLNEGNKAKTFIIHPIHLKRLK